MTAYKHKNTETKCRQNRSTQKGISFSQSRVTEERVGGEKRATKDKIKKQSK